MIIAARLSTHIVTDVGKAALKEAYEKAVVILQTYQAMNFGTKDTTTQLLATLEHLSREVDGRVANDQIRPQMVPEQNIGILENGGAKNWTQSSNLRNVSLPQTGIHVDETITLESGAGIASAADNDFFRMLYNANFAINTIGRQDQE